MSEARQLFMEVSLAAQKQSFSEVEALNTFRGPQGPRGEPGSIDNLVINGKKALPVDGKNTINLTPADLGALPSGGTAVNANALNGKDASEYATKVEIESEVVAAVEERIAQITDSEAADMVEVISARTDENGVVHTSLKTRVDAGFVSTNTDVSNIANEVSQTQLAPLGEFERGSIQGNGSDYDDSQYQYRVRSQSAVKYDEETDLIIDSNYRIYVMYYDDEGTFVNAEGWITSGEYVIPAGSNVRFVIASVSYDGPTAGDADVDTFVLAVRIKKIYKIVDDVAQLKMLGPNHIRTIAHRGDTIDAPENTLSAYRTAVTKGFKDFESDVRFTSDGVPVMIHDDTIDRTSNGTGLVSSFTLAELEALDFGSWKSSAYVGEKIPTFEEMLAFCRATGVIPWIELKGMTQDQVVMLVGIVQNYGLAEKVHWVSFSAQLLAYVCGTHTDANICFVSEDLTEADAEYLAAFKQANNQVGVLTYSSSTTEKAEICKAHGLYMMGGVVANASDVLAMPTYVSYLISDGVDGTRVLFDNAMNG